MNKIQYFSFVIILLIGFSSTAFGQDTFFTKKNAPKKALKWLEKAESPKYRDNFTDQEDLLLRIIEKYPTFVEPYMNLAYLEYERDNIDTARTYVEKAISIAPDYRPKHYLILANYCLTIPDYSCEETNLNKYLSYNITDKKRAAINNRLLLLDIKKEIAKDTSHIDIEKLSDNINSVESPEYKPVLNIESNEMLFTRRVNRQEDFYSSSLTDSQWTSALPVLELNTEGNEGAHTISSDGKWMIFTKCDDPKRYRSCDLFMSKNNDGTWGAPIYMDITNTPAWESHASFSPDGNTIYYSSNKKGGEGGKDIYFIHRVNGKWQLPKNIGDIINTNGNEESPFIHPDGQTLYFMSSGHPGLGGQDLFLSRKSFDGSWSKPMNMGPAINSPKDEGGLFVDVQGKYAYFSKTSKINGNIDSDIYRFLLPEKYKPEPVSYVKIRVKNGFTSKYLKAELSMTEVSSDTKKQENIPINGLVLLMNPTKKYALEINKKGFTFFSEKIDFEWSENKEDIKVYDISIYPISEVAVGDTLPPVSLKNIQFDSGNSTLLNSSFIELDRLVELLDDNPKIKIILNGHTDNVGNEEDNLILSRERAASVESYLLTKQIQTRRITILAFGESQPISNNDTEMGRANNRRIEFQIINPK